MLNDVIVFEKRKFQYNTDGFEEEIWEKELNCWACREKTITTEEFIAQSYRTKVESTYKIRYLPNIEELEPTEYRITHKGKVYKILSITDDEKKGDYLKIQCKMVI